jgi:hypothetical protein
MRPVDCYSASVGFSDATEGGITAPPSGVNAENEDLAILASFLSNVPRRKQIAGRRRRLCLLQSTQSG